MNTVITLSLSANEVGWGVVCVVVAYIVYRFTNWAWPPLN